MNGLPVRLASVIVTVFVTACGADPEPPTGTLPVDATPAFVGNASCGGCHAEAVAAWSNSHHDLAMQVADSETVLGDFSTTGFEYFGTITQFLERDGQYVVVTRGKDGEKGEFPVKYTFGVDPLQQYLVEFPRGHLQVLPVTWDSRPEEKGGQRWMHLSPHQEIAPGDPLYWTERDQNWNYMCAECHSTQVEPGYDASDDSFHTTWQQIDVGCEACHGPGSVHVKQAVREEFDSNFGLYVSLDDADGASWQMRGETGIAERSEPKLKPPRQPEACGRCHSRRRAIAPEYEFGKPLADTHLPALLEDPLYFADGQIRDEVYVYGSFLQSRMYRAGVTCSNCHEPHSLELVGGNDPNAVCAGCHLPAKFSSDEHQRHAPGTAGCVDCHMPERTYMVVDGRRDHSFSVPRPDLSATIGTPNACNGCHADRDAEWARETMHDWYGSDVLQRPEFGTVFAAARAGHANDRLREVIESAQHAGIVRATAVTLLDQPMSARDVSTIQGAIDDPDPLLRIAAQRVLRSLPGDLRSRFGLAGLADPVRSVRMEAALTFADLHDVLSSEDAKRFRAAADDFRAAYESTANRPESLALLGDLARAMGNVDDALIYYRRALALQPQNAVVRANLVDIHRALGNEVEVERVLREGLALGTDSAILRHGLGLLFVRTGRLDESLVEFRAAARLAPGNRLFTYTLAVALNSMGNGKEAVALLESARRDFPADYDIAWALATMYRDQGAIEQAREVGQGLLQRHPDQPDVVALVRSLSTP